jgi:hypothetical protein
LELATSVNTEVPTQPGLSSGFSLRNWYSLLFLAGFMMRFGFVRSARTYDRSANTMMPFGAEVCRIAAHIAVAAGKGFDAPFNEIGINRRNPSGPPGVATVAAVFYRIFLRDNYWFELSLGNYHCSSGMGYMGKHPDGNPRFYDQVAQMGELGFVAYHKKEAFDFLRQDPREFVDLALHRSRWFWDGTPLFYHRREWWSPSECWPLSALAWLGMLFVLTRGPPGWLLFSAALIVYPIAYHLAYLNAPYKYAIEPELLLLGGYLVSVLWS